MRILRLKRLYLPALSIVAVVLILLVLISVSTYRNFNRDKLKVLDSAHRQGLTLIHALEAGARTGMMTPMWQEDSIGTLINETGKNEDIAYIYIFDRQGVIVHHSDPSQESRTSAWRPGLRDQTQVESRLIQRADGSKVYEMAKRFSPRPSSSPVPRQMGMTGPHGMIPYSHSDDIIVLGLKMTHFEEARSADLHHALIMAGILFVLGSGVFFFIFVIQNYYLVDRALKQTQDYTRQVVASMASGLLSVDPDGQVVSYNRLALELLGIKESDIRGMDLRSVLDFKTSGIQDTLSYSRSVLEREIRHRKRAGEVITLALSITPILDEKNNCKAAVIVLRDLTEIKHLQEKVKRSEKLAAIGKLAAGVAHEIRNPLSSIRGFAQFLQNALKDKARDRQYAEIMVREVDRINRVVTDLLTFARPMEANLAPADFAAIVDHALRLVQADARARNVDIRSIISPDMPQIYLDSNQMTQALLNLLLNALQAVEAGGNIEIGASLDRQAGGFRIWIEDDGSGISPERVDKIFEPFFTTREKGTGLGLAIVHKIVENHEGDISVQSPASGKQHGCRFIIHIPARAHNRPGLKPGT